MSEKREIEIKLKSKSAESSADSLNKKVKGVGQSADSADASFLDLKKSIDKLSAGVATISKLDKSVDGLSTSIQQSNAQMIKGTAATSNLDKNIDILNKSVSSADNSMDELTQSLSKNALTTSNANAKTKDFDNSMRSMDSSVERSVLSMGKLSLVASAVATALATSQIQKYADDWTNVNNRLNAATSTQTEFLAAQKGVIAIAQQAGVDLAGVADGYSRIAQNTSELGLSQSRLLDITKKVTLAIKAGGATAQEAASVIVQLGQGLGAGALQGDELRSIMEASIPITKALAKEFGVTTGELKKLGADGAITADRVVSAIERMDESSLTFTKDISGGFTEVSNALTVYVGSVDESLGITEKITGALSSTAKNLDVVVDGITTLAVLIGAKYVGSLTSAVTTQLALTAASLKGTVQMNYMGTVVGRTTLAMNVGAAAAKGLSASLAFLGGPVGVAVIAAAALYSFVDGADAAEKSAKDAADEVNILAKSFSNLSKNRRATLLNETEKEMADLSSQLVIANNQLNQLRGFADSPIKAQGIRQVESQIDSLNQKMDTLSNKQAALIGSPDLSGGTDRGNINDEVAPTSKTPTDASSNKAFESLKARLKLETQAIQEEAEVRRAFAEGLINQQQLDEELALQNVFYSYENRRVAILENEKLTHDQRAQLLAELAEQEIAAEQAKQDSLTAASEEGANDRKKVQEFSASSTLATVGSGLNALANLETKNLEKQKKLRKASVIVETASAIMKTWNANGGYPYAIAPVAAMALAGVAQLKSISSASANGGGSVASTSGGGAVASTNNFNNPSVDNQLQQKTINIVGLENFGPDDMIPVTRAQFESYLSESEGANIAINNGQQNAARIGAI